MRRRGAVKAWILLLFLVKMLSLAAACQPSMPEGTLVIPRKRPEPGYAYVLPGPMPRAGPYRTHMDALLDACPRMLALPNAIGGRQDGPHTVMGQQKDFTSSDMSM